MTKADFKKLKYFSYDEFMRYFKRKGYTSKAAKERIKKISFTLIKKLNKVRSLIGMPITPTSINDGKHSEGSFHYKNMAIDWQVKRKKGIKINYNMIFQACLTAGFKGIGWYPYWNTPGFHTDTRKSFAVWTKNKKGDYKGVIK